MPNLAWKKLKSWIEIQAMDCESTGLANPNTDPTTIKRYTKPEVARVASWYGRANGYKSVLEQMDDLEENVAYAVNPTADPDTITLNTRIEVMREMWEHVIPEYVNPETMFDTIHNNPYGSTNPVEWMEKQPALATMGMFMEINPVDTAQWIIETVNHDIDAMYPAHTGENDTNDTDDTDDTDDTEQARRDAYTDASVAMNILSGNIGDNTGTPDWMCDCLCTLFAAYSDNPISKEQMAHDRDFIAKHLQNSDAKTIMMHILDSLIDK